MDNTSIVYRISTPVRAGKGALFVSNGTYLEPGRSLDEYELIFVKKGVLRIEELDRSFDVNPGQAAILAAGVHHRCCETGSEPLQQYWTRFTCSEVADNAENTCILVPKLTTVARQDRVLQLWQMYMDDKKDGRLGQTTLDLLITLLLCEVAHSDEVTNHDTSTLDVLASQARMYIQEHFHEPISTSSIARALDCNPNYLGRAFHRANGKTITEYIYDVRMFYAREELAYSRKSVTEIAQSCGFANRCYFRYVFSKREGMSPLAYRKRHGRHVTNL